MSYIVSITKINLEYVCARFLILEEYGILVYNAV